MNQRECTGRCTGLWTLAGLWLIAGAAVAEQLPYRVAFADVPGIDDILAGRFDAAIATLEGRRNDGVPRMPDEIATLCGVYVISGRYREARDACERAVRIEGGDAAWNNRGVLRVHLGDTTGALRDFARVYVPKQEVEAHIEILKRSSVPLMASSNLLLTERMQARQQDARHAVEARALRGAEIEDVVTPADNAFQP